jgi:hypothetical protein
MASTSVAGMLPVSPTNPQELRAAIATYKGVIEHLQAALILVETFNPTVDPIEYEGLPPAAALKRFLKYKGNAEFDEILSGLLQRGCNLGERPRATLRTTVTMNRTDFACKGNRVFLLNFVPLAA